MESDITACCSQNFYKEESKERLQVDDQDRARIRQKDDVGVDSLDPNDHPKDAMVSISSVRIATPTADALEAVSIGETMLADFGES